MLIDFHTHLFEGGSLYGIHPDCLLSQGVTAAVDAGTSGSAGFEAFYRSIIQNSILTVKAFISLEVEPSQKPEFYPYIEGCPNVMECNCVTGDYSMFIKVCFHTTQELDQFINQLHRFGRTRTQIVFSTPVEHRGIPAMDPEENE